jgi:predicted phage terminase large subunit-like protein
MRAAAELELRRRVSSRQNTPFKKWLPIVSPKYIWTWPYLLLLYEALLDVVAGDINRLMIFMPPRHGKSEAVTVRFPAWMLERSPSMRFILAAYNFSLASKFSRKVQRIAQSRGLHLDREAIDDWTTDAEGGVRAVGVGSGVTGHGANGIIIDDPVKSREEAYSAIYREKVWDWYRDDLYTRLEPGAFIILIMTRWHHDDLAGRILANDTTQEWKVIKLPAFAEANDPLGRKEGDALCPERFGVAELQAIKTTMGGDFECLYQQNPTAAAGDIFKREWWKYYKALPRIKRIIQFWDTGFKEKQRNDPSSCQTWGEGDNGYYLIDRWPERIRTGGRIPFPDLKRVAIQQYDDHHPYVVLIEDKASGQSLIQELRRETKIPIIAIPADKDKITNAHVITPLCESGRVFLPEDQPWVGEYVDQMSIFPGGAHDEDPDITSKALFYLSQGAGGMGMLDHMANQHDAALKALEDRGMAEVVKKRKEAIEKHLSDIKGRLKNKGGQANG